MAQVRGHEFVIERGEGSYVWDVGGKKYFDGTASLWCVNVGHGRHEIADAARAQMDTLATYQTFGGFANKPVLELADRLAASAQPIVVNVLGTTINPKVFFGLGGGDAIETAAKLARRYFAATGQPERVHIIGRTQGYHGTHGIGTSIGGIAANQVGMGPVDPAVSSVPWDSLEALEAEFERVGPDKVAAVFAEPVIGAGGVHRVPPGYLQGLAALCTKHGALFIADCVIAAFGRLGTMWGVDRFDLRPDMMTFAKGVTSGYLPLGGVVISGRIAEPFWEGDGLWFRHGQTYSGHPTCCAAALANLDIIENEGLLQRGRELEDEIASALSPLESADVVDQARAGIGALGAVSFKPELLADHADLPLRTFAAAKERGVLVRPLGDGVAISPSLVTTEKDLEDASAALTDALAAVASSL
ncbi:MAG: aminotransferase class III-fold pyridoxal phosphate-dependent enzyme [Solirubrobacteraceae bacterium]|nr:aminotransferase class III-fold pyridoxal phosphate-dependent enzyme [Solirubrobacteraceae bacterium]